MTVLHYVAMLRTSNVVVYRKNFIAFFILQLFELVYKSAAQVATMSLAVILYTILFVLLIFAAYFI